ncbi:MAG: YDG domain-containing protein [Pseudomonadota bacterium]
MNRIFKHIWSKARGRLIVVPECCKGSQGTTAGSARIATALIAATVLTTPAWAQQALPTGGQVISGAATIATSGQAMTINQSTDRMIANWQSFSIGTGHSVTFNQPGASSVALNRVVGQDPSQILGSLTANGQVFLVNPNGVVIGKSGSVQAGAFIASTLGISDTDFLAGAYRFSGSGGAILNQGRIDGKVVALIAPSVTNEGTIKGSTALAAGTDVQLDFDGDGLISVDVKASTMATLVDNKGLIKANGGMAILTARGASAAMKGVVNNSGTIEARTIARRKGRILLLGDMDNGEVNVSGRLDASAPKRGDGGFIETSAKKVRIADSASITTKAVSGATGQWLIDPNDYTISASGGDISGATLSGMLGSTNVTIRSVNGARAGNGDIFVNDPVTWSANTLTLNASRNIVINSAMNGSGTAGLALEYGQGAVASGNTATYMVNAPVNLASTGSFSTRLGSDGAAISYTIVTDVNALQTINNGLGGNYVLGSNIDASATSGWNSGAGFVPIGSPNTAFFTGVFDGLGHTISDLTINRNSLVGLFGYANGATFRNVGLVRDVVTGTDHTGGLVGYLSNGTISNSYANGTVGGSIYVGGLVGMSYQSTVSNSYATGSVSGNYYVGGLVGYNLNSTINASYAAGWTIGTADDIGGLVGWNSGGTINTSYASGTVTSNGDATGGLVGWNYGGAVNSSYASSSVSGGGAAGGLVGINRDNSTISNSYATGAVNGVSYTGGLVGKNSISTISSSYASGGVSGGTTGGLVGSNDSSGVITASFYNSETTNQGVGCGVNSGACAATGVTTAQMNNPFTFIDAGWDFASVWGTPKAGGAPLLRPLTSVPLYDYYVRLSGSLSRVYGDSNPSVGGIALDGIGVGNVSLHWGSAITTATNAGSYAWSAPNVLALSYAAGAAGDYYVNYGAGGLSIKTRVLNLSGSRTYDGTSGLAASIFTLGNLANGETLTLSGAGLMANKNAGSGKSMTLGSLTLGDGTGLAANYTLVGGTDAVTINKAVISAITGITANKLYDGTTTAVLETSGASFVGKISGDRLSVASGTGAFNDKNAGTGKTVNIVGLSLGGADAGNYTLASSTATTVGDISKAPLVLSGFAVGNKTYDGTTAATITSPGTLSGVFSGDAIAFSYGSAVFSDKNTGAGKTATLSGIALTGVDAGNYVIAGTATTTADIARAVVAITGMTADNKVYDGTVTATLGLSGASFSGMVSGDSLTVASATGSFSDKNAGVGKTVTIAGLSLGGADAGNYTLASTTAVAWADISRAVISQISGITADSRTYDGTTAATLDLSGARFSGMVTGDNLTAASATGTFSDKNAGTGKTVSIAGLSLGGADAGNYTLTSTTAVARADIAKAVISGISGITANGKTYDGTASATLNLSGASFSGIVADDRLTVASAAGAFSDKNAGTGKVVTIAGLSLGGADAANYTLATTTAVTNADIARAVLTLSGLTVADKIYDGGTAATVAATGRLVGIIPGDDVAFNHGSAAFSDKNAGSGKTVVLGGIVLTGADAGNYAIAETATTTATIDKAVISGITGLTAFDKMFDGSAAAILNSSDARFVGAAPGDQLTVAAGSGLFDNAMPGSGKPVRIIGLSLGGIDAGNYRLADSSALTTANIFPGFAAPLLPDQRERTKISGFTGPASVVLDGGSSLIDISANRSALGHR